MTQPVSPFGVPRFTPPGADSAPAPAGEVTAFGVPKFVPPPPPEPTAAGAGVAPEPGIDPEAAAQADAEAARVEALRAKHGGFESAATSFFRGGLDALLIGGSGAGTTLEAAGALTGNKYLEDFGRGLGRASTGKSAMEALAFVLGGGGEEGAALADTSNRVLREQQEARPTLTTVSRIAGMAGVGLGIGGLAAGAGAPSALLGANVLEGAAAGAQSAYDESAPLRDVLTSAAIGGLIGGAATGVAAGVSYAAKKVPDLAMVFGSKLQKEADKMAIAGVAGKDAAVINQLAQEPERIARVATLLRESGIAGEASEEAVAAGVEGGLARFAAEELSLARQLDETLGEVATPVVQNIDDMIAKRLAANTGDGVAVGRELERQVAPWKAKLAITQPDAAGTPAVIGYRNPKLEELVGLRRDLVPNAKLGRSVTDATGKAHRELLGMLTGEIDRAADAAGPSVGRLWKQTAQAADDFQMLSGALERKGAGELAGGVASAGEHRSALAGALIGAMHASNPIGMVGHALVGGLIHKGLNKVGTKVAANLANRFAKMGTRIPLRAAGGREMQEVMSALAQSKRFAGELAEAAGNNPVARQEASDLAMGIAADQLGKRAGKLNIDEWHRAPLTPLQKVFHRGQILDKVSEDLSTVATRTAQLAPPLPDVLDAGRIAKLTKDANGPEALGLLQSRVAELAGSVPPTPTGEAAGVALRRGMTALDRGDVSDAMVKGHEIANWLDASALTAQDAATQTFAKNAANSIRQELSGEAFGEAGRHYAALTRAADTIEGLSDPAKLREALRGFEGHGTLVNALSRAQDDIAKAYDAAAKLAGVPRPKTLGKDFAAGEHLFHAAEQALTLDGKAMHQMFEVSQHVGIHEAAHPHAEATEMTVADAVDGELDHLVPVVRDAASGGTPRVYRPDLPAAAAASLPLTIEDDRERYKERHAKLTELVAGNAGAEDGQSPVIASQANEKMANLLRDMPKPTSGPLGQQGPDSLSADDLRLANAMWEATVNPLSVVGDLASGYIDPDKSSYAWKQYPGAQRACQAGIVDMLSNDLTQEERDMLPENILTQLDSTFGFGGKLQETSDPFFAARMSEVFHAEKRPPPQPGGMLKLPGAEPTYTQKLAGV